MKIYMVIQLWFIHNLFCYLIICERMSLYMFVYIYIYMTILATNQCLTYICCQNCHIYVLCPSLVYEHLNH